jgi:hypothetical protein
VWNSSIFVDRILDRGFDHRNWQSDALPKLGQKQLSSRDQFVQSERTQGNRQLFERAEEITIAGNHSQRSKRMLFESTCSIEYSLHSRLCLNCTPTPRQTHEFCHHIGSIRLPILRRSQAPERVATPHVNRRWPQSQHLTYAQPNAPKCH